GDLNFTLDVSGKDEVSELKKYFNLMVRALSEKLLMMKYISPHTKRMIELQVKNPEFGSGKIKNVVILFADIRGFTAYSEKREPEEVINNLNLMLSKQSEIIESFGGDIDKFVGDQVIAVFDSPLAAQLAVKASIAMQSMIRENIDNNSFPKELSVGIGIVYGEVMMGNIGSEERKDFTIIGSTVNLGARICSVAKGHEILTSSIFYEEAISKNISKEIFNKKGLLKAKGFSDRILIYSVSNN
ncbi:MAG: adenylate/guanylate cyclase domain-containing protein, partial [Leptospira sp.]|nr:adenylate/guanylate cyclase domain-containing protein [Leptospira sp.]